MSIAAIVLAAGGSSRLGKPKQLIEHDGVPLVRRAAIAAREAGARPVTVVLGAQARRIALVLDGLDGVTIIVNTKWVEGIASSLVAGLTSVASDPDVEAVLITLADQPLVDENSLRAIVEAFDSRHRIIAAAYSGIVGVPALIAREFFTELMQVDGDRGAARWLRTRASEVTTIPLTSPILDIDTEHDEARLMSGG